MTNQYDLYKLAFGYRGLPFINVPATPSKTTNGIENSIDAPDVISETQASDGLNHSGLNGVTYFMPISIGGVQLPNEPTVSASTKKTIVETAMVGMTRRGNVKELISEGDYEISINGVCASDDGVSYPFDQVKAIKAIYEKNEALEIVCAFTEEIGVTKVVLKSLTWVEMKGMQHCQAYKISAVSDEDFLLIEN